MIPVVILLLVDGRAAAAGVVTAVTAVVTGVALGVAFRPRREAAE